MAKGKAKSAGFNKAEMEKANKNMENALKDLAVQIEKFGTSIEKIQVGDAEGAYWSSNKAATWMKNAINLYNNSIKSYDLIDKVIYASTKMVERVKATDK